ncbi:hypothetical protein SAY86_019661 [Trapa natans]|uniref:Zinc finger PHD-type domain-containing protein n=1 Tax=Trapa natans TaxID=22666 RepID=A0AAN7R3G7_TRANT|nr:hypothetical protein SAY86_019661 [Trapa natans]
MMFDKLLILMYHRCEGICMRSFHATKTAGGDFCESLGFINDAQIEAIPVFKCNNCKYKKHQCFACGRLGSSDVFFGAEVFPCFSGTCGHFYHPKCVAELLHPFDKVQAKEAEKKIISGEPFTCPVHKCVVCCQIEDKTVHDLQLAVCRRCPKSYHRKCLPRDITFWSDGESPIRAWNHLLSNRILIYCMNHSIDLTLGTPGRDHIIFPYVDVAKKKRSTPNRLKLPKRSVTSGSCSIERTTAEIPKSFERYFNMSYVAEPRKPWSGHLSLLQKRSTTDSRSSKKVSAVTQFISSTDVKSRSFNWHNNSSLSLTGKRKNSDADALVDHFYSKNDMENRILSLIRDTSASFDEAYEREQIAKANHAMLDRNITLGKVEHYVKAIRTAVEKMEKGSTIEEAKEVCEPGILKQLFIWRKKLTVQMAPFLYGALYTSFGRHFTKSKKLEEIVDRLQWYVQHGDTIVDFCCGANEFSFLLKEKLEKVGKNCFFKNYDLFSPQNNFNFEKRDWMSVDVKELPSGDKLIMALNPPFGVKASLANKFITKAGEFKPKLLILIVPDETERLDTGDAPYDLIWRDKKLLSGKSYLPGSTDANNQLLDDWNQQPPSLYLWSRPDWTPWHKCLAETNGHVANDLHRMMIDINAPPSSSDLNQQPGQCYYDPFTDCWSAT